MLGQTINCSSSVHSSPAGTTEKSASTAADGTYALSGLVAVPRGPDALPWVPGALADHLTSFGGQLDVGAEWRDGAMEIAVRAALGHRPGVWLANFNAPQQTIIAGVTPAIDDAIAALGRAGISAKRIPVACAFHTPLMRGARARLDRALGSTRFSSPRVPVYSNALASAYPHDRPRIAAVLSEHLVSPVRFVDEIRAMYDAGARIFLEVGPRSVLTALTRRIVSDAAASGVSSPRVRYAAATEPAAASSGSTTGSRAAALRSRRNTIGDSSSGSNPTRTTVLAFSRSA